MDATDHLAKEEQPPYALHDLSSGASQPAASSGTPRRAVVGSAYAAVQQRFAAVSSPRSTTKAVGYQPVRPGSLAVKAARSRTALVAEAERQPTPFRTAWRVESALDSVLHAHRHLALAASAATPRPRHASSPPPPPTTPPEGTAASSDTCEAAARERGFRTVWREPRNDDLVVQAVKSGARGEAHDGPWISRQQLLQLRAPEGLLEAMRQDAQDAAEAREATIHRGPASPRRSTSTPRSVQRFFADSTTATATAAGGTEYDATEFAKQDAQYLQALENSVRERMRRFYNGTRSASTSTTRRRDTPNEGARQRAATAATTATRGSLEDGAAFNQPTNRGGASSPLHHHHHQTDTRFHASRPTTAKAKPTGRSQSRRRPAPHRGSLDSTVMDGTLHLLDTKEILSAGGMAATTTHQPGTRPASAVRASRLHHVPNPPSREGLKAPTAPSARVTSSCSTTKAATIGASVSPIHDWAQSVTPPGPSMDKSRKKPGLGPV